jgi:hypothetical protein
MKSFFLAFIWARTQLTQGTVYIPNQFGLYYVLHIAVYEIF